MSKLRVGEASAMAEQGDGLVATVLQERGKADFRDAGYYNRQSCAAARLMFVTVARLVVMS